MDVKREPRPILLVQCQERTATVTRKSFDLLSTVRHRLCLHLYRHLYIATHPFAMTITLQTGFRALPLPLAQLSLAAVLQCGQSFRWSVFPLSHNIPNATLPQFEYRLCLRDRVVCLRQSTDTLFYRAVFPTPASLSEEIKRSAETLAWLRDYFQLDVDLLKLYDEWGELDPVIKRLKGRFEGIRMLRQDPFECLLSYVYSFSQSLLIRMEGPDSYVLPTTIFRV